MSGRLSALLADRRARLPFALIGLALLLLSSTFVVQLETREQSTPPRETDRALERTDSATETALTEALTAATEQAGTRPLTEPAATPYGEVLNDGDPFDQYLKALLYLEAQKQLATAGQAVGDVQTDVSLPEIESRAEFADALDRVTVRPGSETEGVESGVIEAEVSGVTTVATSDGEEVDRQTETVTVAVASPLYELHDRTETFQERLDAGLTEPGFTQRFNARIYALGWARGYAQYSGLPVTEVIANRHVVPSANDAIYRTQKDVFGAADPQLNNAIRRGWLCMAMHDAEGLYSNHAGKSSNLSAKLCEASKWLFGNQATGEVPESPGVMDLLGQAPGMDAKHTIGVNETSLLPIRDLASGTGPDSLGAVLDRIYEVDVETDLTTETIQEAQLRHSTPIGVTSSHVRETEVKDRDVTVAKITDPEADEEYRTIKGAVELELEETKEHSRYVDGEWRTVTTTATGVERISFDLTLEERRLTPAAKIDDYNGEQVPIAEEYVYDSGPGVHVAGADRTIPMGTDGRFENYKNPGQRAVEQIFDIPERVRETGRSINRRSSRKRGRQSNEEIIESRLSAEWSDVQSESDLEFSARETVDIPQTSRNLLKVAILDDLRQIRREISNITHTFERSELVHDGSETGPYGELKAKVRERKATYLDRTEPFANVGQKAIYEARYAYFSALEEYLAEIESAHGSAMGEIDDQLPDTGIENAIRYLQKGVTATPPDPVPLESSSLTDDVTYEVSGSPTYLVTENVTSETVPAIGNDVNGFAPMAAKNRNYLKLPYQTVVDGLLNKVGNYLGLSDPDAELTFQMASEALVAGTEAADAADADPDHGSSAKLTRLNSNLESAVDSAIEEYTDAVGAQITFHLYPEDVTILGSDGEPPRSADDCEDDPCLVVPRDCTPTLCRVESDSDGSKAAEEIQAAVTRAVEGYGGTAETADAIASGEIREPIVKKVTDTVSEDSRPRSATGLNYQQWRAIVNSTTHRIVRDAAAEHAVTLSDTETVEELDTEIRRTLESVSKEIVANRFDAAVSNGSFDIGNYENWVGGTRTPVRVPAGMPVIPVPSHWFATVNAWNIDVKGEYARFEVSANVGTPETATATTYVREEQTVEREIAGSARTLGSVEPIAFSGKSVLIVVVPPGGVGVGDRDDEDPECSPTWPVVGDVSEGTINCNGVFAGTPAAPGGRIGGLR